VCVSPCLSVWACGLLCTTPYRSVLATIQVPAAQLAARTSVSLLSFNSFKNDEQVVRKTSELNIRAEHQGSRHSAQTAVVRILTEVSVAVIFL